ncbi:MAG: hypothetical protein NTV34_07870 [Proteobacteria bacterium]|nr:hypothetical protein [Pseudomonadota bacterium]
MSRILSSIGHYGILVQFFMVAILSEGCATKLWPFSDESGRAQRNAEAIAKAEGNDTASPIASPSTGSSAGGPRPSSTQEMDLKQAKIWNRLDDLEDMVRIQKEQIRLLEQGLLTGLPPEQMKRRHGNNTKTNGSESKLEREGLVDQERTESIPPQPILGREDLKIAKESAADDPEGFRVKLQIAKDYFQGSRFGMAIAELAQISKTFGSKVGNGEPRLYLARSYLGLKEHMTARSELESFIKDFPSSEYMGVARLELARAYLGLNLRDRARKELASIANEYVGREEGDMAVNELKTLRGNL